IHRETHLRETQPHMLSGHYQGRVLSFISKLKAPRKILEIGTFTGYATLCLAEGLRENGELHTIDMNIEREERVRGYFAESEWANQIHFHIGDAWEIIPHLPTDFDLIFIDADKKRNFAYFDCLMLRSAPGAVFLIDNVLWKGRVIDGQYDKQTEQIRNLNEQLAADPRVEKLILPIRDGLF